MNSVDKAAHGLRLLEEAVVEALRGAQAGLYNSELARALKIENDYMGRHNNYLTYSVLGGLLKRGIVISEKRDNRIFYVLAPDA